MTSDDDPVVSRGGENSEVSVGGSSIDIGTHSTDTHPLLDAPTTTIPWDVRRCRIAGGLVLASITLERLAYYALVSNLYLFLNKGETDKTAWTPESAMTAILVMSGIAYGSSPIGGWLADALIGRYWAVVCGYVLYIVGFTLAIALSKNQLQFLNCNLSPRSSQSIGLHSDESEPCVGVVYLILCLIGVAVAIVKTNFPPFGAEQVKYGGPNITRIFFNWYYWCVNIGSLVGIGILSYVEQNIRVDGFFYGYLAAGVCLLAAAFLFIIGRPFYLVHEPEGSALTNLFRILWEGLKGKCNSRRSVQSSPVLSQHTVETDSNFERPSWLDYATVRYGGSHHDLAVEDLRQLGRVLLLLSSLVPFWIVYFQMETAFQAQALHMKITFSDSKAVPGVDTFTMPTAWLTMFDQMFILILIPVLSSIVYPALERCGIQMHLLHRMAVGMAFSFCAVLVAGILAGVNTDKWNAGERLNQTVSGTVFEATTVSILWQIPQYSFVGAAEVLAGIASLEFSYTAAPRSLQGVVMGLHSALEGIGSLLGTGLVTLLSPLWIKKDPYFYDGHLNYYFFLLGGIQLVTFILFTGWLVIRYYRR